MLHYDGEPAGRPSPEPGDSERVNEVMRQRLRAIARAVSIGIVLGIALSTITIFADVRAQWGSDYAFFVEKARRWLELGEFFNPHQLAGPYEATSGVDVLYPPVALYLFVPFVWLPAFLWWVIPLGILAWHLGWTRPAWWSWPILAILAWVPRDQSIVIWGNTAMWVAAFVALGLRFAWASPLILFKPNFLPFALIGVRRRSWWLGLAAFAVASLLVLPMWFDYLAAMANNVGRWPPGLRYFLQDYLFIAIPVVAWLARSRREEESGVGLVA